jgi:hypothetical protein
MFLFILELASVITGEFWPFSGQQFVLLPTTLCYHFDREWLGVDAWWYTSIMSFTHLFLSGLCR